ncbi:MAG: hypothetical protein EZS28_000153 [Streblomastix strix]|uniref:Uncharacterized protein n=1 Tax=Streblomastix strix TaxID=222440 RepID=A0A5J4XAY6_9EUKA|nr:MAG: hypothetical protein EZS28_000153 [Streblomastix strix]
MGLFKDIYNKLSEVQVAISGQLNMYDGEFQRTSVFDNYVISTNTNQSASNDASNESRSTDSFINEVIIKHEKQIGSSPYPQYKITNVFNQFIINEVSNLYSPAFNTFYIVVDGTCSVCVFNLNFESKRIEGFKTKEVGHIPDFVLLADGKNLGFPAAIHRTQDGRWHNYSQNYFIVEDDQNIEPIFSNAFLDGSKSALYKAAGFTTAGEKGDIT